MFLFCIYIILFWYHVIHRVNCFLFMIHFLCLHILFMISIFLAFFSMIMSCYSDSMFSFLCVLLSESCYSSFKWPAENNCFFLNIFCLFCLQCVILLPWPQKTFFFINMKYFCGLFHVYTLFYFRKATTTILSVFWTNDDFLLISLSVACKEVVLPSVCIEILEMLETWLLGLFFRLRDKIWPVDE